MSDYSEISTASAVDPQNSRRLFNLGCTGLLVVCLLAWWRSPLTEFIQLLTGITILVLGCLPGLLWARYSRPWFPCFEISMLTCVVFYAFPLLSVSEGLRYYPDSTLEMSGLLVVAYLGAAILSFNSLRQPQAPPPWAKARLLPDSIHRYLPAGLLINTGYIYISRFTELIPYEFSGTIRALCFGLGTITAFIYACEWGRDRLSREEKTLYVLCMLLQVLLLFSHLYLINGVSLIALALIGYTTTRRRLPLMVLLAVLLAIAVLHNGKSEMRKIYWGIDTALPSINALPAFFAQWVGTGLKPAVNADDDGISAKLADRASLLQMIALSVDQVPSMRPHLGGESYVDIPAQIIPRFLWPEKPSSLMSNVRLAIYFNLIDPNNPYTTSIAFGIIAEAYVNFGLIGVIMIGALTGFAFKYVVLRSIGAPLFSSIGIFMILLTAWSFQAEQVLTTWLTSLFQASAVGILLPLAWKRLFGAV